MVNNTAPNTRISFDALKSPLALMMAALAAAFGFAFFNGIENLFKRWGEQQELSHGYFLPVIAGWMLWSRRDAIVASLGKPNLIGLAGVAAATVILILTELTVTSLMIFQHFAMILLFASMALTLGGRNVFWISLLPVAYLIFMVPPPYWAITVLSQQFQFWSSQLGAWLIGLFGIPVFLSGNVIDLGDYQLQVAEACSGLRYLFPFLSLGFLAAYLFNAPLWQRVIVFLSTIPITIIMNSFRIALTGVLVEKWGSAQAEGLLHFFEGWVVFVLCMLLLFGVIALLARFSGHRDVLDRMELPAIAARPSAEKWNQKTFNQYAAAAIVMLVGAGLFIQFGTSNTLKVPARTQLAALPADFAGWRNRPQQIDSSVIEVLGADDYILTDMTSPDAEMFNLYVTYLNMQRHGHSWHSPRQCIPGGGWQIVQHDIVPTETAAGERYFYNRIIIENRGSRQLLYYWYDQRGRRTANEFVMKALVVVDAISMRRTDGAMIRIMTPIARQESVGEADTRLLGFMRELEPKLPAYIPARNAAVTEEFDPDEY